MIPRTQAVKAAEETYAKEAEALEARLDEAIRTSKNGYIGVSINESRVAVDLVKKKYEEGGWQVNVVDDQRDGCYMSLT